MLANAQIFSVHFRVIDNNKEYLDFSFIFAGKPVEPMVFQGRKKKINGISISVEAVMAL